MGAVRLAERDGATRVAEEVHVAVVVQVGPVLAPASSVGRDEPRALHVAPPRGEVDPAVVVDVDPGPRPVEPHDGRDVLETDLRVLSKDRKH